MGKYVCQVPSGNCPVWMYFTLAPGTPGPQFWFLICFGDVAWWHICCGLLTDYLQEILRPAWDDRICSGRLRITYKAYWGLHGMITCIMYMLQPIWQCWNCNILWAGITSCWQCWCTAGWVAPSVFTWNTISSPCYLHWPYAIIIPILWLICICTSWWALMLNI